MLVLAYVKSLKIRLCFEAFQRAGDSGSKLSVLSCEPLLSALLKEKGFGYVDCVYREVIRRIIEQGKGRCQRLMAFYQMWLLLIL